MKLGGRKPLRAFVERPALAGTRAPNALFFALVVALLCDVVVRLTRSRVAGVAAVALYVTFPETLVRGAYAGYFSVTVFAMLVVAMLFDSKPGSDPGGSLDLGWLAAGGAFAALVDHKTVVLILAVAAVATLQFLWDAARLGPPRTLSRLVSIVDKKAIAVGAGFSLATFTWWGYGLVVDSATFVRDHLRMHIAHRFLLNDIRVAHDSTRYAPSMMELWAELAAHTGYLFVPVALVGIGLWVARRKRLDMVAVLAAWFLVGSVLYTLTDWRQTKHMMNQVAPAVAAAVVLVWPRRETDEDVDRASSGWSPGNARRPQRTGKDGYRNAGRSSDRRPVGPGTNRAHPARSGGARDAGDPGCRGQGGRGCGSPESRRLVSTGRDRREVCGIEADLFG